MKVHTDCTCETVEAEGVRFETVRSLGYDTTDGRYGEPSIERCQQCGQLWLHYSVEYSGFSRSGRWARGKIDPEQAMSLEPEQATDYLAALPSYIRGGSYFRSAARISGSMPWS